MKKRIDFKSTLLDLQKKVHDFGTDIVADELNISPSSLYKQLDWRYNIETNPVDPDNKDSQPRYKLGFKTLFKICSIINDFKPVVSILNSAGYGAFKLPKSEADINFLALLGTAMDECNDVSQTTIMALADKVVTGEEAEEGIRQCDEAINAISDLKSAYEKRSGWKSPIGVVKTA